MIIRVDFSDVYHVYLSVDAIQKFYFVLNGTNEISAELLQNLVDEFNPTLLLINVDKSTQFFKFN